MCKKKFIKYNIFGISKEIKKDSYDNINKILTFPINLKDLNSLEKIIQIVNPKKLIHLGAISESEENMKDIFETIEVNGLVTCKICDILHKNNIECRLFNAASSDMYKGHKDYVIQEDDTNFRPTYPYAYAKILGYSVVEYYRKKFGYLFSNGVLFTTESKDRKSCFLMKKLSLHINEWKNNKTILKLSSLESYRNLNLADDVVDAIELILEQPKGDNYLICSDEINKIVDIVKEFYKINHIELYEKDYRLIDKKTGLPVIEYSKPSQNDTKINGKCIKLKNFGWKSCSLNQLLEKL